MLVFGILFEENKENIVDSIKKKDLKLNQQTIVRMKKHVELIM